MRYGEDIELKKYVEEVGFAFVAVKKGGHLRYAEIHNCEGQ